MRTTIALVATIAAFGVAPARAQGAFDWIKKEDVELVEAMLTGSNKFGPLIEAAFGVKLVAEVSDWSESVQRAAENGTDIPAPPTNIRGTETMLRRVATVRDALSNLDPTKDVDFGFPSLEAILVDGERGVQALAQMAEAVNRMRDHRRAVQVSTRVLEEYVTRAEAVVRALNKLSRALQDLYPKVMFKPYMDALGFAVLDIENHYRPAAGQVAALARRRARQFRDELSRRTTAFENVRHNVRQLLSDRQAVLEQEAAEITDEIGALNTELTDAENALAERAEELLERQDQLRFREERLQEAAKAHDIRVDRYHRDGQSLKDLRRRIDQYRYTGCPNGHEYGYCTHNAQKAAYAQRYNRMVDDYNQLAQRLGRVEHELASHEAQLKSDVRSWRDAVSAFNPDATQFERDRRAWAVRQEEAGEEVKALLGEIINLRAQRSTIERALATLEQAP